MKLSNYYLPVIKEDPADAAVVSHKYMIRAGMIRQASSGIYTWLPIGLMVLRNIENIIREEMNKTGAFELLMPTLQSAEIWQISGRYDDYGPEMLRVQDRHGRAMLFGPTHEEQITQVFKETINSYKDLPLNLYQIQWKFRDEIRPRFGVMRGREFLMKDAYSFDLTEEASKVAYNKMFASYIRIFERVGLVAIPMQADSGPIGGNNSHEFLVLADTGESEVFCDRAMLEISKTDNNFNYETDSSKLVEKYTSYYAATSDKHNPDSQEVKNLGSKIIASRGIEVGHVFLFGEKYSKPMGANIKNADGVEVPVSMGSYGIGVSRLVAAYIEANHDKDGIKWSKSITPFQVAIATLSEECNPQADRLYADIQKAGFSVIYDDRNERAGVKFATLDLIGIPYQIIIGKKELELGSVIIKDRASGVKTNIALDSVIAKLRELYS